MTVHSTLLKLLSSNRWFAALSSELQEAMVNESTLVHLRRGEMLYRRGDHPNSMYGVVSGALKLSTLRSDGKEAVLAVIETAVWFAESSLVNDAPRPHDAIAMRDTEVLTLPRTSFNALMKKLEFAQAISLLLASRVRLLYGALEAATLSSVQVRIVHRLLMLAHGDAAIEPDIRPRIPVSQEALSMMLGITRQTLGIELKLLEEQGAIRIGYRYIDILSEEQLRRICDPS